MRLFRVLRRRCSLSGSHTGDGSRASSPEAGTGDTKKQLHREAVEAAEAHAGGVAAERWGPGGEGYVRDQVIVR